MHEDESTRDPKEDSHSFQGTCSHPRDRTKLQRLQEMELAGGPAPKGFIDVEISPPPETLTLTGQCMQCGDMVEYQYKLQETNP